MPRYDASGPVEVDVDLAVGYAEVIASDRTDVVVDVVPTVDGRAGDTALAAAATVTFDDGRLRVRLPRRLNLFGQNDSADVRIEVPTGSRATIGNAHGSVRTRGRLGDVRIAAKHGTVSVDCVADLSVDSRHGTVEVSEVRGRLDVLAGHGHVRVESVGGDAVLRGSHGVIELGTVRGTVEVTTSGPLTIDHAIGDVRARSAHGAIRVREVTGGTVALENGFAEVEVGVPAGVAAWVDAASAHGAVRNELTPDPAAAASDRTVQLHLRADWADVVIRRAPSRSHRTLTTAQAPS